ncbi:hypothetical protein GUITHDRAFT_114860 [Guillardia theta CCMP2712]|uniref:Uncharacterized protein n=1 Tax=Guillardia theta (strain CCMP2712) TaxID=905079 RepID=L1IT14_GUITC|nr:hypothetical protein GUITHDRAFT_114860 [Guillardia theta CCMP2712]EKX38980.1 hypothetical protein GUITHDRAFT_114860 [Guillardia theta CCMP2712]|eukprot:XP_005825960.1 hypothetical protein GUITHDRAFT_114860 [Guillardia theta CCMP2712]
MTYVKNCWLNPKKKAKKKKKKAKKKKKKAKKKKKKKKKKKISKALEGLPGSFDKSFNLNLRKEERLLERMMLFKVNDNNLERYSLHIHTVEKWKSRPKKSPVEFRVRGITALNIRKCKRRSQDELFDEEERGEPVLPENPEIRKKWQQHLNSKEDIEWLWQAKPAPGVLPKFDKSGDKYKDVLKVLSFAIKQREASQYHEECEKKAETQRRMRGSPQEATVDDDDDDDGELLVLEIPQAVALCMGIEEYRSLPTLPGIQEETLRLLGALRQVPRCLAIGWYQQADNRVNVETFIEANFSAMKSLPPTFALLHFSGHVVVHRSTGELWLAAPSFSANDVESDKERLDHGISLSQLTSWWKTSFPSDSPQVLLIVDGCRSDVSSRPLSSIVHKMPAKWTLCCFRSTGSEGRRSDSAMCRRLVDRINRIVADRQNLQDLVPWMCEENLPEGIEARLLRELPQVVDLTGDDDDVGPAEPRGVQRGGGSSGEPAVKRFRGN